MFYRNPKEQPKISMGQGFVKRLWDIENIEKARKCCSGDRKIAIGLFCLHKLTYAIKGISFITSLAQKRGSS